jgi:hypothetical protein
MRGVGIDLRQSSILDGRNNAASGNAHSAVGVKPLDGHESDYGWIIWEALTTLEGPSAAEPRAKAEYLAQRRKGKEKNESELGVIGVLARAYS